MKHDGSTSGRSSMRGKCQRVFFNAWNGGKRERCSEPKVGKHDLWTAVKGI